MNTALKNIRRTPFQALAAIFVVSITLFVVGIFTLVTLASHSILLNFETKPQIIAYLKDGHTTDQVAGLISNLTSTQGVKNAIYISKQDALELYKKSVGNDPILLGTVTDWGIVTADILPASVEITASDPKSFGTIVSILEKSDVVSETPASKKEIDFPEDVISELTKWTNAIRMAGLLLIIALTIVCVLTIMIIISMKISSRRLEIGTLKLLGARNFYIIKPYLLESVIYGLVGALFGWVLSYITLLYSTPFLAPRLGGVISFPIRPEVILLLLLSLLVFGLILSFISSFFAAARFVKRSK
ncbi:MAG: Cell division protein FtsX [Candidatus Collierbacteria bacterium GW2011_GWB1_45_35]|uniref:Cell division protein FtsX n=2 Tax=Candidatus Collieribacteriota TaxID=1752725 RepID=A0A0G1KSB0_9BACT|nr:MAG: Cell division protein FtsX [Microgenomates group bacterium GW2011_GWC1_44_23]KKT86375.1 MAG: Cell division protein FtsX [Candidatus Collierbacteria bacterium GW2011_GWA2_44_99]KKT95782.1 MAG: Cell division protein FtsX [Candidatus Collierbacteria bacterium GW2011_GWA1_45_15]KKU00274.1 MAG: Cell division protein FtsX [Candidatus Collierbacteria bacterium GW2011_GWB2_45_17]KKU05499.1 MAG: Cell division protein FtsX [Candidatus Collierbacteria bacterium GW2011_GWB1_45_35]KKU08704.1 MAG: C